MSDEFLKNAEERWESLKAGKQIGILALGVILIFALILR